MPSGGLLPLIPGTPPAVYLQTALPSSKMWFWWEISSETHCVWSCSLCTANTLKLHFLELPLHRSQLLAWGSHSFPSSAFQALSFAIWLCGSQCRVSPASLSFTHLCFYSSCESLGKKKKNLFFLNSPKWEQPARHGSPDCALYTYAEKSCVFTDDKQAVFSRFLLGIGLVLT